MTNWSTLEIPGLRIQRKWVLRCQQCRMYHQVAIGDALLGIKADRHLDKYPHRMVARLEGSTEVKTFARTDEVKPLDDDVPPY